MRSAPLRAEMSAAFSPRRLVLEEYRGKGYGRALFEELKKEAARMGGARMEWLCLTWNTPSMEFYRKNGGQLMDTFATYRLPLE